MTPAVSVLMPVFNGERHLREAMESVLQQTFRDWELLVVDDGSTDGSGEIAASFGDGRVRVIRNDQNAGLVATLNRGLAEARGDFVARLDADDVCSPDRLAEQVSFARGNPAVPLIGCDAGLIAEDGRYAGRWRTAGSADLVRWELCFRTPFAHSSAFFRRKVIVEKFGGYRERRASEDLDLWSRIGREHPVVTLRRPLVKYRQRSGSIMAVANADGGIEDVRENLRENIAVAAPGLDAATADVIAGAWSGNWPETWSAYFEGVAELQRGFSRGRGELPGLARVRADENYTLWNRAHEAGKQAGFLRGLRKSARSDFLRMPWIRIGAASMR